MSIEQTIERILFGQTTEEAVAKRIDLIQRIVDRRIEQVFDRLATDDMAESQDDGNTEDESM